jgi:DNA-binding MarR family transcriptional regulator
MVTILARQLMLGSIAGAEHMSANPAAWRVLAERGLVETKPVQPGQEFPVVVSLTEAGRAALQAAKTATSR